jgi:ubiquinone/menaquinone biosynthesis C-methylase UbiE
MSSVDMKGEWDEFWERIEGRENLWGRFLSFYRIEIIARSVGYYIDKYFRPQGVYLECGAGTSETTLKTDKKERLFTAIDYSAFILKKTKSNPKIDSCLNADLFFMPIKEDTVDGIWNIGVMEHFTHSEIDTLLGQFYRVLKKDSYIILFWPMKLSPYEIVINIIEFFLHKVLRKSFTFYPNEISRLSSKKQATDFMLRNDFKDVSCFFNHRDLFSFCVVVAKK